MADKYKSSFVSKRTLDADRESRRSYLEQELDKARTTFETEERLKKLREQRGETTWMLPSLNERIKKDKEKVERKKKKKHDKKSKKYKKEKKKKKKQDKLEREDSGDSSNASTDEDWVEKQPEKDDESTENVGTNDQELAKNPASFQREDWMMSSSLLDTVANKSESIAEKRARRKEERQEFMKPTSYEPGQHPNELNPYWKDGGTGVPMLSESENSKKEPSVSDAGLSWVKRAYKRAQEQAEEQGRSLEAVVAERFGSMEKLNALLQAGERRSRRDEDRGRRGWRRDAASGNQHKQRRQKSENDENERSESSVSDSLESKKINTISKDAVTTPDLTNKWANQPVTSRDGTNFQNKPVSHLEQNNSRNLSSSDDSDSEKVESSSEDEEEKKSTTDQPLTEKDINEISAKILRAELMGNQDLVDQLKAKLKAGRVRTSITQPEKGSKPSDGNKSREEDEVVLTRTDKHGNVYPLKVSGEEPSPRKKRKKTKNIETHDAKGNRVRYFQEDDSTDLKSMVEEERLTTSEDHQHAVMSRLSRKAGNPMGDYYTLDDMFESSSASKESRGDKDERIKKKAIAEHQRTMTHQANCRFCFDNPDITKHLIISIASHVYLALPITSSLTEGHCLIVPMQHITASTYMDENVMEEVTMFKKSLVKLFKEKDEDVIFLETVKNFKRQLHAIIECIPVPKEIGDEAPIYFKKAIQECESEWAQNKKVVEVTRNKGIKGAIPKGLPYFAVEFGLDGGFAHVIEDEASFSHYFGKEIIGSILDLEPVKWRKPPKESFQQHKRKVLNFSEIWEPYDWTRDL